MSTSQQITLTNINGMEVDLLRFGARIRSIKFPVNGQLTEMTLAYDEASDYITDEFYLGATCGPISNRISNGQFEINNTLFQLSKNNGENCLHGGEDNFSNALWQIDSDSLRDDYVKFTLKTHDLERGYPGNNAFSVEYKLNKNNQLEIVYGGKCDKATPMNLTNHAYFNLGDASCLDLNLTIESSSFLERLDDGIPTGKVKDTEVFGKNLRSGYLINEIVNSTAYPQVCKDAGLDHCFILDNGPFDKPKAELYSKSNGVKLKVYSDQPTIQVYTGNYLTAPFNKHSGVALECHGFVDAPNQKNFANIIYTPNETYHSKTVYSFEVAAH